MKRYTLLGLALLAWPGLAWADDVVAAAKAHVAASVAPVSTWDGPTTGPKAQPGKTVIYISADQRNRGALGVGNGVAEAAAVMGWNFKIIDGQGSVPQQTAAIGQAMALRPDGIILGTIDAVGQKTTVEKAISLGIKVVGWRARSRGRSRVRRCLRTSRRRRRRLR